MERRVIGLVERVKASDDGSDDRSHGLAAGMSVGMSVIKARGIAVGM
jgi:predicted choloylglycine hydrolase